MRVSDRLEACATQSRPAPLLDPAAPRSALLVGCETKTSSATTRASAGAVGEGVPLRSASQAALARDGPAHPLSCRHLCAARCCRWPATALRFTCCFAAPLRRSPASLDMLGITACPRFAAARSFQPTLPLLRPLNSVSASTDSCAALSADAAACALANFSAARRHDAGGASWVRLDAARVTSLLSSDDLDIQTEARILSHAPAPFRPAAWLELTLTKRDSEEQPHTTRRRRMPPLSVFRRRKRRLRRPEPGSPPPSLLHAPPTPPPSLAA